MAKTLKNRLGEPVGEVCTCKVCGQKFIDTTGEKSLMCPKCIKETISRHKSPDISSTWLENGTYHCKTNDGKEWTSPDGKNWVEKHDDSLLPQIEAFKYATSYLKGNFIKKDSGKLQWSLMPFEELKDVVKVLMHGAEKYSPDNWKKCDNVVRYKDALMRHVIAYVSGEEIDSEFGLSHLAHAVCNCLFLMWFDKHKDDKASE